ncbi:hypothetical protein VYU27_006224 [Nannochloropsis oceanica]
MLLAARRRQPPRLAGWGDTNRPAREETLCVRGTCTKSATVKSAGLCGGKSTDGRNITSSRPSKLHA